MTRSRRAALVGVVGLVGALVPGAPASATSNPHVVVVSAPGGAGVAECGAVGLPTGDVIVHGTAIVAGATSVSLVCHLWQNGPSYRHRHVGGIGTAGVAAAVAVASGMHVAQYSICTEVFVVTLTGSAHYPCPAH